MNRVFLILALAFVIFSCNRPSPEKYFTTIVLNTNLLYGFAGEGMQRQLSSPSARLVDIKTGATEPEKRTNVIEQKTEILEKILRQIKNLPDWSESNEMHQAAIDLYEYVLPVYKTEYKQLAELYDKNTGREQITKMEKEITDKYEAGFEILHNKLISAGKLYAAKHKINVRWDVRTRP